MHCSCVLELLSDVDLTSVLYRLAYRSGVTKGVVAPTSDGFLLGISAAFSTAAKHKLQTGAIVQEAATVHVSVHPGRTSSVSTQIAALRHLLLHQTDGELGKAFERIRKVRD